MPNSKLAYFCAGAIVALASSAATLLFMQKAEAKAPAAKYGSHVLLPAEDYIEIQQLMSLYPRAVDPGSIKDASWMFTKDGAASMGVGGPLVTTPDQLKKFYTGVKDGVAGGGNGGGVRHFNTSYVIVGTPDGGARGSAYMMQVERKKKDGPAEITWFGKYEDKFVKTPDGWRIKERVWTADTFLGSNQPIVPSPLPNDPRTYGTGMDEILKAAKAQSAAN